MADHVEHRGRQGSDSASSGGTADAGAPGASVAVGPWHPLRRLPRWRSNLFARARGRVGDITLAVSPIAPVRAGGLAIAVDAGADDRPLSPADLHYDDCRPDGCSATANGITASIDWTAGAAVWRWPRPPTTETERAWLVNQSWHLTLHAIALRHGGVAVHACALCGDRGAVVVAGRSGAGKTTLGQRLRSRLLHDDFVVAVPGLRGWEVWVQDVYRAPRRTVPRRLPLQQVFLLGAGRDATAVRPLGPAAATAAIVAQIHVAGGAAFQANAAAALRFAADAGPAEFDHCLADDEQAVARALGLGAA